MDLNLLNLVRCPVTQSRLRFAEDATIERLNQQIGERTLLNRSGALVESNIDAGLINEDGDLLIPIRQGITIMVSDQAIPLSSPKRGSSE